MQWAPLVNPFGGSNPEAALCKFYVCSGGISLHFGCISEQSGFTTILFAELSQIYMYVQRPDIVLPDYVRWRAINITMCTKVALYPSDKQETRMRWCLRYKSHYKISNMD